MLFYCARLDNLPGPHPRDGFASFQGLIVLMEVRNLDSNLGVLFIVVQPLRGNPEVFTVHLDVIGPAEQPGSVNQTEHEGCYGKGNHNGRQDERLWQRIIKCRCCR